MDPELIKPKKSYEEEILTKNIHLGITNSVVGIKKQKPKLYY